MWIGPLSPRTMQGGFGLKITSMLRMRVSLGGFTRIPHSTHKVNFKVG